jgi:predicted Zn-dependent protease
MLGVVAILKNQEEFELQRAKEEGREPRVYHGVFSTHPENDARLQEVIGAADQFKNPNARQTDPEKFLKLMDGVTFGDSESQGIIRGNHFYHKGLDFTVTFPDSWRMENQPTQLVSIRSDNNAAIIMSLDELQSGESAAQYLRRKFGNLKNGQNLGGGAFTGLASGKTPFGESVFRVTSVPHGENVFIIAGFAKGSRPDQQFIQVAESIRRLKPDEQKLATAKRIRLVRAKPGDTFSKLAQDSDIDKYAVEQLRLLNGMYPDGEPEPGQLIKIIK